MAGTLIIDTSAILAAVDSGEPDHTRVRDLLEADPRTLLVTDLVLAEADYLILKRLGAAAERELIEQVLDGTFLREALTNDDLRRGLDIAIQLSEHELGLTDATLMALSERRGLREVLTLDRRHFSVFRDRRGRALTLLP